MVSTTPHPEISRSLEWLYANWAFLEHRDSQ